MHIRCQIVSYSRHQRQVSHWRGHVVELTLADLHLNPVFNTLKVDLVGVPGLDGRVWPVVHLHGSGQLLAGIAMSGHLTGPFLQDEHDYVCGAPTSEKEDTTHDDTWHNRQTSTLAPRFRIPRGPI